jgi:hypothetical protein
MERELKASVLLGAAKLFMPSGVKMQCDLYDQNGSFMFSINCD